MLRLPTRHVLFALLTASLAGYAGDKKPPPPPVEPPAPKVFARPEALMSTETLAGLIKTHAGSLVVVDARGRTAFDEGHIAGAHSIESDFFQDPKRPPHFLPAPDEVKKACAAAGIRADSRVVIYDEEDGRLAARVWFTLHAYGHDGVAILDGGAGKWRNERRAWNAEPTPVVPSAQAFEPLAEPRGVCAFADLAQFRTRVHTLGQLPPTTLLDARSLAEYMGDDARAKHGGHIPGAANIEWSAMLSGKERERVWRAPPEIHAILRMAGVDRERRIAVYDQAGGRSAHLYFTLWLMGFDKTSNYVGGWREYGARDDVEIER
jgi:thiosulfate/3-mercaptopyruvate sulfurtransferase